MKFINRKYFLNKYFIFLGIIIVFIIIFGNPVIRDILDCDKCEKCLSKNEIEEKNNYDGYLSVFENDELEVLEKKIDAEYLFEGASLANRIKNDLNKKFDCEWKGKEVVNYRTKEEYCKLFGPSPVDKNDWVYYELLKIRKENDDFSNNYKILIDKNVVVEKEMQTTLDFPIQAVKFINNNFVVDFQTNLEIVFNEEKKVTQGKGYYSSIWINEEDVLNSSNYKEAFSPHEFKDKLLYFISKENETAINYNDEIINLPYSRIPHFGCCDEMIYNIKSKDGVVDFFGLKDDNWYHVQIKSKK